MPLPDSPLAVTQKTPTTITNNTAPTVINPQSAPFTASTLKPPKPKKPRVPPVVELPYGALDVMRYHQAPKVQLLPRDLDTILLCTHDLMLPDLSTMHTRMLLVAWELELEEVTEEAAKLLVLALQVSVSLSL